MAFETNSELDAHVWLIKNWLKEIVIAHSDWVNDSSPEKPGFRRKQEKSFKIKLFNFFHMWMDSLVLGLF